MIAINAPKGTEPIIITAADENNNAIIYESLDACLKQASMKDMDLRIKGIPPGYRVDCFCAELKPREGTI